MVKIMICPECNREMEYDERRNHVDCKCGMVYQIRKPVGRKSRYYEGPQV